MKENTPLPDSIKILDYGHVALVDMMGSDASIVRSARVSYQDGTKTIREDAALINYLMKHRHTSPFESVEFVFDMKIPIFVARHIVRHRTASLNEVSGRYSELPEETYLMPLERMNTQSKDNKQGSTDALMPHAEEYRQIIEERAYEAHTLYKGLLANGMSKELARTVLPVSQYTQWIWKCDLHNLFHFLKLRMDCHTQLETRVVAEAMYELIQPFVPAACEAFEEHILFAKTFSKEEVMVLESCFQHTLETQGTNVEEFLPNSWSKRTKKEFLDKLGL